MFSKKCVLKIGSKFRLQLQTCCSSCPLDGWKASWVVLQKAVLSWFEALPGVGWGGGPMSPIWILKRHVGVYKCFSLIVGFGITIATWPREVVSCRDFILRAVATFWAMSLVRIYPGRASDLLLCCTVGIVHCPFHLLYYVSWWLNPSAKPRNYPWVYQEIY